MRYKIVDLQDGVITIEYESGLTINLDLPIVDNKFPEGKELDQIIKNAYPGWHDQRKAELAKVKNSHKIPVQRPPKNEDLPDPVPGGPNADLRALISEIVLQELGKL